VQAAPRPLDQSGIQNRLRTLLRDLAASPGVSRAVVKKLLERAGLPLSEVRLKQIKKAMEAFGSAKDSKDLLATLDGVLPASAPATPKVADATTGPSSTADRFQLVCFEFIIG